MKRRCDQTNINQRGAALVTVLFISLLLLTASAAMLTAVGSNSRNTTDVLSETKAYYAAESGLQATINVLRNTSPAVAYSSAANDGSSPNLQDMSTWLPYNWPTSGTATRAVIGGTAGAYTTNLGTAYSILVNDPDDSATRTTFNVVARFSPTYISGTSIVNIQGTCLPSTADCQAVQYGTAPDRTTIYIDDIASTTVNFSSYSNPVIGSFRVVNESVTPAHIVDPLAFTIIYNMTVPRAAALTIRGSVTQPTNATNPITATFESRDHRLMGSNITLCTDANCGTVTPPVTRTLAVGGTPTNVWANVAPIEPNRLRVVSTGYGPGSVKTLEAIVRKNLFDALGATAATTMLGSATCPPDYTTCLGFNFSPGNSSNVTYSGGNSTYGVPSFGLTNPGNLTYVVGNPPHNNPAQMQPPPALLNGSQIPSWQQSPAAMDALVDQLRTAAQNAGTYHYFPSGGSLSSVGNFTTGRGITFCEGSCNASVNGGGILVVTGKLTNNGGFSFNGLILVTGEEGWVRTGGGNGSITGNVIIAPYNKLTYVPENLSSTFLPPRYSITGGGTSDVTYSDVNTSFDVTNSVSDFVAGVAEK